MRVAASIALLLSVGLLQAQQDEFGSKLSVQGGMVRSLGDITSGLETFDPERTAMLGLSYEHFLSYGVSLYVGYEYLRLSGNDRETGQKDRSLNFLAEVNTAQLGFRFYADNGRLLNYDARFAPFLQLGIGAGMYEVYGDLFDERGARYNYWSDGTIRSLPESAPNAASAQLVLQDGQFETRLTDLATEEGKPRDNWFLFVPARLGMKWRINERFSAELSYAFNWTFSDHLDDVSGDHPATFASEELAYISNPAGHTGTRGNNGQDDHFHHLSLGLSLGIGRRSYKFRMPPVRAMAPVVAIPTVVLDSTSSAKPKAVPTDTVPKRVVIEVESIRIGRFEVDTIITGSSSKSDTVDVREESIEKVRKDEADNPIQMQGIRSDTLTAPERSIEKVRNDEADNPIQKQGIRSDTLATPVESIEKVRKDEADNPIQKQGIRSDTVTVSGESIEKVRKAEADNPFQKQGIRSDTLTVPEGSIEKVRIDEVGRSGQEKRAVPIVVPVVENPDTLKQSEAPRDTTGVPRKGSADPAPRVVPTDTVSTPSQTPKRSTEPAPTGTKASEPTPKETSSMQPAPAGKVENRTTERIIERTAPPVVVVQQQVVRDTVVKEVRVLVPDTVQVKAEPTAILPKASVGSTTTRSPPPAAQPSEPTATGHNAVEMQRDHAVQMNRLLNKRIGMLESFLAAQEESGSEGKVDELRQRIAELDGEVDALRKSASAPVADPGSAITMVIMDTVRFVSESFDVPQSYQESLRATAKRIIAQDAGRVLVTGHTDSSGDAGYNLELSQRRAEAAAEVLRDAGVPDDRIKVKGLGQELARTPHDRNERVVVVHVAQEE